MKKYTYVGHEKHYIFDKREMLQIFKYILPMQGKRFSAVSYCSSALIFSFYSTLQEVGRCKQKKKHMLQQLLAIINKQCSLLNLSISLTCFRAMLPF